MKKLIKNDFKQLFQNIEDIEHKFLSRFSLIFDLIFDLFPNITDQQTATMLESWTKKCVGIFWS